MKTKLECREERKSSLDPRDKDFMKRKIYDKFCGRLIRVVKRQWIPLSVEGGESDYVISSMKRDILNEPCRK